MRVLVTGGRTYGYHQQPYLRPEDRRRRLWQEQHVIDTLREMSLDWPWSEPLDEALNQLPRFTIITGGATGADHCAAIFADVECCGYEEFKPDWRQHGRAAGPIRNQRMLDEGKPDLVVAFPGGAGTRDMVRRARAAGADVVEVGAAAEAERRNG